MKCVVNLLPQNAFANWTLPGPAGEPIRDAAPADLRDNEAFGWVGEGQGRGWRKKRQREGRGHESMIRPKIRLIPQVF